MVLEIAGDAIVDERLIHGLSRLSLMGYSIALDNFVYRKDLRPLLEVAKIVKIDALTLNDQGIVMQVNAAREFPVKLLAYKVETHDSYQYCKQLGFTTIKVISSASLIFSARKQFQRIVCRRCIFWRD